MKEQNPAQPSSKGQRIISLHVADATAPRMTVVPLEPSQAVDLVRKWLARHLGSEAEDRPNKAAERT